jgi:hypothetical protein
MEVGYEQGLLMCVIFFVTAPAVVFGAAHDSDTDWIEVDEGRHGHEGLLIALHQDAFKAAFPEGSGAVVAPVTPLAEALFEFLLDVMRQRKGGVPSGSRKPS